MYQHSSADMEKIREQTHALFCEALLEKNIEEVWFVYNNCFAQYTLLARDYDRKSIIYL